MATFLVMSRHTPQNCPNFNPQSRKVYASWLAKGEEINKKYGLKLVSYAGVFSEHLEVWIMEAPSLEAIQKAFMEPELLAVSSVNTMEIKLATNFEESMKLFQQLAAPVQTR